MRLLPVLLLLSVAAQVCAQQATPVPDSGRWQELRFSADEVAARGEDRYIAQVVDLAAAGMLDRDRALLARLQSISTGLVRAAVTLKPEAVDWQWELHLSSDPSIDAICLAGGKLLVGIPFVQRLHFDDGELATLLAHEIAHAIAEHQREYFSEALLATHRLELPLDVLQERLDSDLVLQMRLARLSAIQEREADQLGMVIAHRRLAADGHAALLPQARGRQRGLAPDRLPPRLILPRQPRQRHASPVRQLSTRRRTRGSPRVRAARSGSLFKGRAKASFCLVCAFFLLVS